METKNLVISFLAFISFINTLPIQQANSSLVTTLTTSTKALTSTTTKASTSTTKASISTSSTKSTTSTTTNKTTLTTTSASTSISSPTTTSTTSKITTSSTIIYTFPIFAPIFVLTAPPPRIRTPKRKTTTKAYDIYDYPFNYDYYFILYKSLKMRLY